MNQLSKEAVKNLAIGEEAAGQRIDHYLSKMLKGVPRSHVYRILRSGEVRINGRRVGPDVRLAVGDRVRLPPVRIAARAEEDVVIRPDVVNLRILYEDDCLLAADKPSGLAVHGGSGIRHGLIEQLRASRPELRFLELVHRLDRDTSGILLLAKKRASLVELHRMLREGEIDKRYLALVRGRWRDEKRAVHLPLHEISTRGGERRIRVDMGGREAVTVFRRLKVWPLHVPPMALLEAELKTGRTHQIRVHLTHLGFPIAGDDKYGDFAWNRELARQGLKRMFLHAYRLTLAHPLDRTQIALESPLPSELQQYLERVGGTVRPR